MCNCFASWDQGLQETTGEVDEEIALIVQFLVVPETYVKDEQVQDLEQQGNSQ